MYDTVIEQDEWILPSEPLASHTSYRVGGPARWLAQPPDIEQLARLVQRCRSNGIDWYILGAGANLLVGDEGVDGMVIQLDAPAFRRVQWPASTNGDASEVGTVRVGGGADMMRLIRESVRRGWAGLEGLAGIPGTIGGIIRMNAGGRWGQIADVVSEVTVVDREGQVRTLQPEAIRFGYRTSGLAGAIVCAATLRLRRGDPARLRKRLLSIWRTKQEAQPFNEPSAGCVFKNPPNASAGALIDRAGLKGACVGNARVSEKHGNFIVTAPGATAADILSLIALIRERVAELFGIALETEIEMWGCATEIGAMEPARGP